MVHRRSTRTLLSGKDLYKPSNYRGANLLKNLRSREKLLALHKRLDALDKKAAERLAKEAGHHYYGKVKMLCVWIIGMLQKALIRVSIT